MATRATLTLQQFADAWELMFTSAVFSGIVGDTAHALRGGYHISIGDQSDPANYSVVRPDDKAPPGTWPRDCASAVDMNLGLADMKTCHLRMRAVFADRANDPRAKYVNAWNGWDGVGNAGRYDMVSGTVSSATDDHKWHMHLEFRRRYVNDADAANAVLSILRGESAAQYLGVDDMEPSTKFTVTDSFAAQFNLPPDKRSISASDAWQRAIMQAARAAVAASAAVESLGKLDARLQVVEGWFAKLGDPALTDEQVASAMVSLLGPRAATVLAAMQQLLPGSGQ